MSTASLTTAMPRHAAPSPHRTIGRRRPMVTLPYGWPLTALVGGLGVWWAVGLSGLAVHVFGALMLCQLLLRRVRVRIPRGFGLWIVFVGWAALSIATLGLDPVGYLPDSTAGRVVPFAYRFLSYAAVGAIFVYAASLDRSRYPQRRLARVLGVGFGWVALGGYLGLLMPRLEFTSPVEWLLPPDISSVGFVQSLVHPQAAQLQDFLGYLAARPAAPFGFTNMWGHGFALLLPWFVVGFIVLVRGWRRWAGVTFLAAAMVPAIASLNRGLWIGIALAVAYAVLRQLLQGRFVAAAVAAGAAFTLLLLVAVTPLGSLVQQRLDTGHSDEVRSYAAESAVELAATNPIIGYGSTRTAYGSARSIAVGRSADCPQCGNFAIGTHGQLWFEVVAHGFVGAALYVLVFCYLAWRYRSDRTAIGIAGHLTILLMLWFMFIYSALPFPLAVAFLAWAALWRNEVTREDTS